MYIITEIKRFNKKASMKIMGKNKNMKINHTNSSGNEESQFLEEKSLVSL